MGFASGEFVSARDIEGRIEESLIFQSKDYSDRIKFSNSIMLEKDQNKGYQCLNYKIEKWNVKGIFDIMNGTSKNVTLVKFMDTVENINNAVSIVGYWIFYSKY